nr:DUF2993 domain-containing protein [Planosporangium thailandense]
MFVVADRVAANMAEQRIADQAATEMRNRGITSDGKPTADIAGFPFLTQVMGGTYQKVTITVDHPRNDQGALDKMTLVATNIHAPLDAITSGHGQVKADAVQGTATVGWSAIRDLIDLTPLRQIPGLDVSQLKLGVKNDHVNLTAPISIAGFTLQLQATGTLAVNKGEVRLQLDDVRAADSGGAATLIPQSVISSFIGQYRDQLAARIAVPNLPYSLVVNKVATSDTGVLITATAADVVLSGQS